MCTWNQEKKEEKEANWTCTWNPSKGLSFLFVQVCKKWNWFLNFVMYYFNVQLGHGMFPSFHMGDKDFLLIFIWIFSEIENQVLGEYLLYIRTLNWVGFPWFKSYLNTYISNILSLFRESSSLPSCFLMHKV